MTGYRLMAKAVSSPILQWIRVVKDERMRQWSDQVLLQQFCEQRDESAFATLLHRHGPMALGVCRTVLGNEADAEDAFQATFLILARKAASIRKTESVGSWLHGVAYRTALKARARSATRKKNEVRAPARPASHPDLAWREVQQVLHEELTGLAARYRGPLVACYLEGKTQVQAAAQLGVAVSTLKVRMERGRALLRARLVRRGLGPAAILAAATWPAASSASVPATLASNTIQAAQLFAAGQGATTVVSAKVAALTEGVLKTMWLTKVKIATAVLVTVTVVAAGASLMRLPAPAAEQPKTDKPVPKERAKPGPAKPVVVRQDAILQRMAMSPDGEVVATVGVTHDGSTFNSTVKLWDARTGKLKRALDEEKDSHLEIAFSQDLLAIGVNGKLNDTDPRGPREVRLLDAKTLKLKHKIDETLVPGVFSWGRLVFSPDGKRLAVAGGTFNNGFAPFLKLWDVEKQKLIEGKADFGEIPRELNEVECLAFSPDGKLVAAAWRDGKIRLFDGRTGDFRTLVDPKLKSAGHGVRGIAFSPDGKTLASRGNDNTVVLWDLTEPPSPPSAPDPERVRALVRQLDDNEFTTREKADREIRRLGKAAVPLLRRELTAAASAEIRMRLSRILEALKEDEGKPRRTLKGHKGQVDAIAFSKDGRMIATGGGTAKAGAYEVILWDAKTGEVKRTFAGLTEWVHVVAFSPDGKTLAVCGGGGRGEGKVVKTSGELTLFRLE